MHRSSIIPVSLSRVPLSGGIGGTRSSYRTKPGTNSRAIERVRSKFRRSSTAQSSDSICNRENELPLLRPCRESAERESPQTIRPKDVAAAAVAGEEEEDDDATFFFFPFFYLRHTAVDWPLVGTTHKHLAHLSGAGRT